MVQTEGVHEHGMQPGAARADDVDAGQVADVPRVLGVEAERVECNLEDARIGLHHADDAGVDHALHLDPEARAHLQDLEVAQPLTDETVGVRDEAQAHAGLGKASDPVATTRRDAQPQRGVGELAVEVLVHVVANVVGKPACIDVRAEVLAPRPGPVGDRVDVEAERGRGRVVHLVEIGRCVHVGPRERVPDPSVLGQKEHAARVEQHSFRWHHAVDHTQHEAAWYPAVPPHQGVVFLPRTGGKVTTTRRAGERPGNHTEMTGAHMETSGETPDVGLAPPDLAAIFERPGPFATVYLNTDPAIENAAQYSERRWRAQSEALAGLGAPESVLAAIDTVVPDAHLYGAGLGVVADGDVVAHVEHHPHPPAADLSRWSPLPSVAGMLEWRQGHVPHVLVLIDRRGADLYATDAQGTEVHDEAGADTHLPVEKVAPGGWSQRRYQQRAEVAWEKNASAVADELVQLVERVGAQLVVVAGDVRATQLLRENLPDRVEGMLHEVSGGRARDGSEIEIAQETARLVATAAARDTVAVLEKFREERGEHDRAADGAAATFAALQEARVEMLLVHDDPDDRRTAWFGERPADVALQRNDLIELGIEGPQEGRLVDVAVRAALGTGATVRVVPKHGGANESIGAILRWREPAG